MYVAWSYEQVLVDERVMFGTCVGCWNAVGELICGARNY